MFTDRKKIDSHCHASFLREDFDHFPQLLEEHHIEKTLLFGLNFPSSRGFDEKVFALYRRYPEKIVPFACDFGYREEDLAHAEACLQRGFYGFGELLIGHEGARQDGLSGISYDDPVPLAMFHLAGENAAPVLIHCDAAYRASFLRALAQCPETTFLWAHVAYDFASGLEGELPPKSFITDLLARYDNLYFDISYWEKSALCLMSYTDILEKYSQRFVWGLDMTDHYRQQYLKFSKDFIPVFAKLSDQAQENILYHNISEILRRRKRFMA